MYEMIFIIILGIPFLLTGWNIFALVKYLVYRKEKYHYKVIEVIAICVGAIFSYGYLEIEEVVFVNWDAQLYNGQVHSMIAPNYAITIATIVIISFLGYIALRFIPSHKQPPMVSVLGIAVIYLGISMGVLWCIQTWGDFFLLLWPVNCIIIFIKTIYILVYEKTMLLQNSAVSLKLSKLSRVLDKATNLPFLALILAVPLLGVIVAVLLLCGQEPNSLIKAWTDTADWTLSQKMPPQNIIVDEHYLCTVAAGGHRKVVKPLRTGVRHGHIVLVNRQLCIANAFEQILEEKVPAFHKIVRTTYDRVGYPISKHIHSKYLADIIYILMKPLEWLFLFVLYTVDVKPENRIAIQYPHSQIPDI